MKQIDASHILKSIEIPYDSNVQGERLNESILRVLCLN